VVAQAWRHGGSLACVCRGIPSLRYGLRLCLCWTAGLHYCAPTLPIPMVVHLPHHRLPTWLLYRLQDTTILVPYHLTPTYNVITAYHTIRCAARTRGTGLYYVYTATASPACCRRLPSSGLDHLLYRMVADNISAAVNL